ncbi:MAG: class III extradiol ring-cleavage dioxygenase [Hyphomicrobiales bacterium]|nr:class III extradiol ring-cleavage dioxygenase [Hyphomicrobiales bacterium]
MTPQALPALFLAHGAPDLTLTDRPAKQFMEGLGETLPRPRAILAVSAHWEASIPTLTAAEAPETVHDFSGWPDALYDIRYPAKTAPWLIDGTERLLRNAGFTVGLDEKRGFDHGAWAPLRLIYPGTDIPIVQLSLLEGADAKTHYAIGQALEPLRQQGVLIAASGATVHNLRRLAREGAPPADWAVDFDAWVMERLEAADIETLTDFERQAPNTRMAHPTPEHFLPLFVALGAAGATAKAERLHHSYSYGSIGMSCFAFQTH